MKRYKHIPTGRIYIKALGSQFYRFDDSNNDSVPDFIVEKGSDWEEVKDKPEWTILSFKTKSGNLWTITQDGLYECPSVALGLYPLSNFEYSIHSVRRESDGEVFTVGDKCTSDISKDFGWFFIEKFTPTSSGDSIVVNGQGYQTSIHRLQKVKPKEWEITSFEDVKTGLKFKMPCARTIDEFLNSANYSVKTNEIRIYSIKRLSDGVEFKIGDKFKIKGNHGGFHDEKDIYTLSEFDKNSAHFEFSIHLSTIKDWVKVEKLFTTEDGVDVYDQCTVFYVRNFKIKQWHLTKAGVEWEKEDKERWESDKLFSTKEAAEEYIVMNKPCLSIMDIITLNGRKDNGGMPAWSRETYKQLVRKKLK